MSSNPIRHKITEEDHRGILLYSEVMRRMWNKQSQANYLKKPSMEAGDNNWDAMIDKMVQEVMTALKRPNSTRISYCQLQAMSEQERQDCLKGVRDELERVQIFSPGIWESIRLIEESLALYTPPAAQT